MFVYHDKLFVSYQDIIDHALKLEGLAQKKFVTAFNQSHEHARANVGYFSGYYHEDERLKICEIFGTEHPIFGNKKVSHKEAYELGKKMGKRLRGESKTE
jgi:hypothetical protein